MADLLKYALIIVSIITHPMLLSTNPKVFYSGRDDWITERMKSMHTNVNQSIQVAFQTLESRFINPETGLLFNYTNTDGTVQLPAEEECSLGKPIIFPGIVPWKMVRIIMDCI